MPPSLPSVIEERAWQTAGRTLYLQVYEFPHPGGGPAGQPEHSLSITGDDIPALYFVYQGAPYEFDVSGTRVRFCGHDIEATPAANLFRIDGTGADVGPPSALTFSFINGDLAAVDVS
jgi:hypothetical protein